jgi:hypothetical protein
MAKAEISWKRVSEDGEKFQVYAQHVGVEWRFFIRQRRYDNWRPLLSPLLTDWLELLDGVRRRVARRLLRPEEVDRLLKRIKEEFPEENLRTN